MTPLRADDDRAADARRSTRCCSTPTTSTQLYDRADRAAAAGALGVAGPRVRPAADRRHRQRRRAARWWPRRRGLRRLQTGYVVNYALTMLARRGGAGRLPPDSMSRRAPDARSTFLPAVGGAAAWSSSPAARRPSCAAGALLRGAGHLRALAAPLLRASTATSADYQFEERGRGCPPWASAITSASTASACCSCSSRPSSPRWRSARPGAPSRIGSRSSWSTMLRAGDGHARRLREPRPLPLLRVLGGHADPDVPHHRGLGRPRSHLRRHEVRALHDGGLAAHAGRHPRALLSSTAPPPGSYTFDVPTLAPLGRAARARRRT